MAYTIPKGATLSGIAQQKGTTIDELMKLNPQITDPNLIYAGASLTLPERQPVAPIAPTADPTGQLAMTPGIEAPAGTPYGTIAAGTADTYRQQLQEMMTGLGTQQQEYLGYLKGQPSPMDLFSQYRTELGLPEQEATMRGLQERVQSTTDLINSLEEDIMARSAGKMVTAPHMRRQMAVEQRPLARQLGELTGALGVQQAGVGSAQEQLMQMMGLAQTEQERGAQIAGAPFELTKGLLPSMMQAAQYQSPQEQMQQMIAQEEAMRAAELGRYTPTAEKPATTTDLTEYNFARSQGYTGTFEQWKAAKKAGEGEPELTLSSAQVLTAARTMKQADVGNLLRATYSEDELKRFAKEAGYTRGGFLGIGVGAQGVNDYLNSPTARERVAELLEDQYRTAGYTIE